MFPKNENWYNSLIAEAKEMNGEEEGDQIDLVFTKIYEILEEHSIDVDDLLI